jgi:hypothetical protein
MQRDGLPRRRTRRRPKEAKATKRKLGRGSAPQLRDRPTPATGQQPLDSGCPSRADRTAGAPSERAKQGP